MKHSSWHRVFLYGYAAVVAGALCLVALSAGLEIRGLRQAREHLARESFDELSRKAASLWQSGDLSEATRLFSKHLSSRSTEEAFRRGGVPGEIRIILQDEELDYLWAAGSSYFGESLSRHPRTEPPRGHHRHYSRSFAMPEGPGRVITAAYPLLFREDLFPVLKRALGNSLIILAGTTLVTLGVFLRGRAGKKASSRSPAPPTPETPPAPAAAAAATAHPEPRPPAQPEEPASFPPDQEPEAPPRQDTPATGLQPESTLEQRLASELERASFSEEDLTVVLLEFTQGDRGDQSYQENAGAVLSFFALTDLCFEYGPRGAAVLIPNTTLADALAMIERFQRYYWGERLEWGRTEADFSCGASSRAVRFVQAKRLLAECAEALKRSRDTPGKIMGFQPDPQKYREYLKDLEDRDRS